MAGGADIGSRGHQYHFLIVRSDRIRSHDYSFITAEICSGSGRPLRLAPVSVYQNPVHYACMQVVRQGPVQIQVRQKLQKCVDFFS